MTRLTAFDGTVVVAAKTWVAEDVVLLRLERADGAPLPAAEPGDHIELDLHAAGVRQYSLCGPEDDGAWTIAVLREAAGRGGSEFVHDLVQPGQPLRAAGPRHQFALGDAPAYLFVCGGIGITPVLPMLRSVVARGAQWRLVYGGRRRASMAFVPEVEAFGAQVRIHPEDEFGLLPLAEELAACAPGTVVYACGPAPLLDALVTLCVEHALELRLERFAVPPGTEGDTAFEVELAQSGLVLQVPADRSILEVVEDAGVDVLSSCRAGTCGTCEVTVLEGEPIHRDTVLTDDERASGELLMMCTARSRSPRLVLDC